MCNAQDTSIHVHNIHTRVGCWGDGEAECAGEGSESSVTVSVGVLY